MGRWLLGALGALLVVGTAHAGPVSQCSTYRVTASVTGVPSTTTVYELGDFVAPVAAYLKIVTTGGGTPSVAVSGWAPATVANGAQSTDRGSFAFGTLNASTTYIGSTTPVHAFSAAITGCTTTCDLRVTFCGTNAGGRS